MPPQADPPARPDEAELARVLSGFLDGAWYLSRYPDVAAAGLDPVRHFISHGAVEQRDPNRWFDSAWYAQHYPDVGATGQNPLLHYLRTGAAELRNPHPRFDAAWYVDQHPEAAANPLLYHLRIGLARGWLTEKPIDIADYLPSTAPAYQRPERVAVDVVIPAYRGLDQTSRCIRSVLADPERPDGRVIVVDDRSPEPQLSAWLDQEAAEGRIVLIRNRRNLGFVGSANRGMLAAGHHDVALLNSDTEVPPGWLARLAAQAHAGPRIASVSPFSNNATICSYPRDAGGSMPFGLSLAELDDACRTVNAGRSVAVPTTVGFCMYIRRDALDDVGVFDEKGFGRGYGEENDFCMRAAARGWRHMLACDTFVYHEGSVSFGAEAGGLAAQGLDLLSARYPHYRRLVAQHVGLDAVGPYRFALTAALFRRSAQPTILMLSHDLGGGVRTHIDQLVRRLDGRANCLLLEGTPRGAALSVPAVPGHPVLTLPAARLDDLVQFLRSAGVCRVHIHHLAGMDLDARALIHRLQVPFDTTVHDYFAICPQVNLLPWPEGAYCGEPGPATCNACIAERPSHGAREILSWRREQAWQFLEAERVLCPSADLRDRLARHGLAGRAIVAPHDPAPSKPWPLTVPPLRGEKLRVALLGVLANHKGAHIAAAVAASAEAAGLEIHLIGHTEDNFPAAAKPLIQATGAYEDKDLPALLARIRPHVVWFPAPWPETFSYTLSAAIAAGLPIVASRIGAFPERLAGRRFTWLVEPSLSAGPWLDAFEQVRASLRAARPPRKARCAADAQAAERGSDEPPFYPDAYLAPIIAAPVSQAPVSQAKGLADLRRAGRISVVVIPERFDTGPITPCAYIRLLQPLDHPAIGADIDIILADPETALRYQADIIATQRHAVADASMADALAAHARRTGAALLYDLDDDLLRIPSDHPDADALRPKAKAVQRMLRHADQVWVSTPALAASLAPLRTDARVVINGLDERLWGDQPPAPHGRPGPVRILCMGTATHDADFAIVLPALVRLRDEFGDRIAIDMLGVTSRGDLPGWINRLGMPPNATLSYPGFVNWIVQQPAWDIGLAPLADTPFNLCKSAIKTLDYAALGACVLASDMPVYRGSLADGAGGLLVRNEADAWHAALSWLVRDAQARQRLKQGAVEAFAATGSLASQAAARRQAWHDLLQAPRQKAERARKGEPVLVV